MKTARFATIVETCGAPSPYVLWTSPERDATFRRAVKDHRVMTVHQETRGTKKDYAVVGFSKEPHAEYLVFHKSLRRFEGTRVVGINYDLLAPEARPPRKPPAQPKHLSRAHPAPARRTPEKDWSHERIVLFPSGKPSTGEAPAKTSTATRTPKTKRPAAARGKPHSQPPPSSARVIGQIERAIKELKAGQAVAASERLQDLSDELKK